MLRTALALFGLAFLVACNKKSEDTGSDTGSTADTADTADSGDSGDSGGPGDSGDTGEDTGEASE